MLIKKVSFYDFLQEFEKYGRGDQFTYDGKRALYNYLNELSEDIGEAIELDIISLCCEFVEYNCFEEFIDDYGYTIDINDIEDIKNYTTLIPIDNESFIIQVF